MADSALAIRRWPGYGAAALVAALVLATLLAVVTRAETGARLGPSDFAAIRFTVVQAIWSASLSVLLAIPLARGLARRRFWGRGLLLSLLGAPFLMPVIVAVLGLLAVFGRNGIVNAVLGAIGLPEVSIYGAHGVVLAHVFFNLPLATRFLLQGWQAIPSERFRLAAQLGMGSSALFRVLELPMLRRTAPGAWAVIFAICLSSFAVALTLGGGPRATTVELAIYEAFRFEFDLARAALLGLVQLALAGAGAMLALRTMQKQGFGAGLGRVVERWDAKSPALRGLDAAYILAASAFLALPLIMIILRGLPALPDLPLSVWRAGGVSLAIALASMVLTIALALPMSIAASGQRGWVEVVGLLGLAASPLVVGTGLFILIHPVSDPLKWAVPVTAAVNAVSALPFALRVMVPAVRDVVQDYGRLSHMLRLRGFAWLRIVLLPRIRAPLGFSAGLAAALSMGDLGVIALFAGPELATLPLQMYRLMGAYRMEAAAGAALLLVMASFCIFWMFDAMGRRNAES